MEKIFQVTGLYWIDFHSIGLAWAERAHARGPLDWLGWPSITGPVAGLLGQYHFGSAL
jgi:hypothetical protein